jgi:hypothetical protein
MFITTASLGKITSILANASGLLVGISMVVHGNSAEIILAVSVICGHLGTLLCGHESHDPNHIVIHRQINNK